MDSDLAWVNIVNGKSGRQWYYADVFQRSTISGAIYHFYLLTYLFVWLTGDWDTGGVKVKGVSCEKAAAVALPPASLCDGDTA